MLGSVFALKTARQGWVTASLDMLVRTWRLYRTNTIVFALFGALERDRLRLTSTSGVNHPLKQRLRP